MSDSPVVCAKVAIIAWRTSGSSTASSSFRSWKRPRRSSVRSFAATSDDACAAPATFAMCACICATAGAAFAVAT
ncbi:MAG: hypothetical protein K8W52_24505 [Deltaproteobacteria bacterium]|nr:hypothetical protein [Deltaproteobacteria bacterium]